MIQSLQVPTATLIDQNGKTMDNVKLIMVCVCVRVCVCGCVWGGGGEGGRG